MPVNRPLTGIKVLKYSLESPLTNKNLTFKFTYNYGRIKENYCREGT